MPIYKVPVVLEVVATAFIEARNEEAALELARTGEWEAYEQQEIEAVRLPDVEDVEVLAEGETGYLDTVLRQRIDAAHEVAESMSQEVDHPLLHLLDAAKVLLGVPTLNREQALTQASEAIRRALGDNPPMWAEMRALLNAAVEQLDTLQQITVGLDDGEGADGQDWDHTRDAANDLAGRVRALLARLDQPSGIPTVRVHVCGGRATVIEKPFGVAVEVRDYDTEGDDPEECGLEQAADNEAGKRYASDYLGPMDEVMG
jgi:hypothetical protein